MNPGRITHEEELQAQKPTKTGLRPPTAGLPNEVAGRSPGLRGS